MADKPGYSHALLPPFHAAQQSSNQFDTVPGNPIHQSSPPRPISSSSGSSPPPSFPFSHQYVRHSSAGPMATNFRPSNQTMASMAPPATMDTNKKLDISSLMSPPDHVLDSFSQGQVKSGSLNATIIVNNERALSKQPLPMSPPISPYTKPVSTSNNAPGTPPSHAIKDPVLYPSDETSPSSPPQPPLFAPTEFEHHKRIVDNHVRARSSDIIFSGVTPPRREDYELALTFKSQVMKHFTNNRKGWLRKERALLMADRQAGAHRYHSIMPAKPIAAKPTRSHRADRVTKPHGSAPRPIRTNATGASASPSTNGNVARPSARRPSATPEPSRRIVAPNREDKDFNSLPDFCPPLSSLPNKANSLKVDWKGQPIDLTKDPHQNLLHPDEVLLAGNLRLDCATYLTSKRRMFERRLQCLRTGKEFRKTDAQQACKIDVNKASKLWTAFDKVGWLDAHWVRRFL